MRNHTTLFENYRQTARRGQTIKMCSGLYVWAGLDEGRAES